ncbi:MAG: phosphopantothenoylcysteine decarboxylase [Planctomycetes bacterium]|nr:phosphopantothenoylcysteine decarboxylase [Planctomycetota bacterium]
MAGGISGADVLITAGPTYEFLDDVRYLGNPSTGRMGLELAEAARNKGAVVTMVIGPNQLMPPPGIHWIQVVSATEMLQAVKERFDENQVFIASAAVSDYRPTVRLEGKEKKGPKKKTLELIKNPDILKTVTRKRRADQVIVGFSLESDNLLKNARKKMTAKRCDLMVVNSPGHFGDAREHVWILNKRGVVKEIPPSNKKQIAEAVIGLVDATLRREILTVTQRFEELKL